MKLARLELATPYLLAPMAGYTDKPFRELCKSFGASLTVSELISVNAIYHGNRKSFTLMERGEKETPFCIQLFGFDPELFLYAAKKIEHLCDCIDINAGCPVRKVVKSGAGAYLLKDKERLFQIVDLLKKHIEKPLSVKLRKGFGGKENDVAFYKELENRGVDYIVLHPRMPGEFFSGEPDYEHVREVKEALKIEVVVSGGIDSVKKLRKVKTLTGCNFFMIGQASIGRPYIFEDLMLGVDLPRSDRFVSSVMRKHLDMIVEFYGKERAVHPFKKFFHAYVKGFKNARALNRAVNATADVEDIYKLIDELTLEPQLDHGLSPSGSA